MFLDDSGGGNKTLRKWKHWLGRKIRVIADHKPLSYLDSSFARHNPGPLHKVEYFSSGLGYCDRIPKKGRHHGNADALSRVEKY